MSRKSRRLRVRVVRAAVVVCSAAVLYQRWRLRSFGLHTSAAYRPVSLPSSSSSSPSVEESESSSSAPRAVRWQQLSAAASPENPFDLLVVGGGLTGLYTAVDAAQRGLRVALVDAADIGGGSTTSAMPTTSPGALPYVQRAIRQRDTTWLRVAMTVMAEETTWGNVASSCVKAPGGVLQWVQSGLRRVANTATGGSGRQARGGGEQPETTTMLLPALHSSEMVEYACAAILSTFLSLLCGPLRPASILTTANVEARLPALSHHSPKRSSNRSNDSSDDAAGKSAGVRVKGGVVTRNLCLDGNAAAAALAVTAAELGVVLCTYAPVVKIAEVPRGAEGGSSKEGEEREKVGRWSFRRAATRKGNASSSLLVAQVHDALAAPRGEHHPSAASPSSPGSFLPRWFTFRTKSTAAPAGASPSSSFTSSSSTTAVYARTIVNCAGCDVDAVKARYAGNTQDTVPAAFAGFLAYSYFVAPADAVHATRSGYGDDASWNGVVAPPLATSLRATGLHFSSPRLSFASAMVLPWRDRCVLIGPSITPLAHAPTASSGDATSRDGSPTGTTMTQHDALAAEVNGVSVIHSKDGYAAQRDRVVAMLASCGVTVDTPRLLSCISQTVPYVKSPKEVPFQQALLRDGYALHFSSLPVNEASDSSSSNNNTTSTTTTTLNTKSEVEEGRRVLPLLHVYGGSPIWARRIAEDVVDALVSHAALADTAKTQSLHGCRTHRLRLSAPQSMHDEAMSAVTRLEALVGETYAERLTDIVSRRTHVAYTSSEDAVHALPSIGAVMGRVKEWSSEREEAEVDAARRLIASVAVSSSPSVM